MNNGDTADILKQLILGIVVIAFAIFGLTYLVPYGISVPKSIRSEFLSPRFWPSVILYCLLFLGFIITIKHSILLYRSAFSLREFITPELKSIFTKFIISLILIIIAIWNIEFLGFPISVTFIMFAVYFLAEHKLHLIPSVIILLTPWILYFFFTYVANIIIPLGIMFGGDHV